MEYVQVILTEDELNVAVKTYQKRLRLEDWSIVVRLVPQRLIFGESAAAVKYNLTRKEAVVCIAEPATFISSLEEPQNMLHDLYHELIHLLFPMFKPDEGVERDLYEFGIDTLAYALFASQRIDGRDVDIDKL